MIYGDLNGRSPLAGWFAGSALLVSLAAVGPAAAQPAAPQPAQPPQASAGATFLSRFGFHVGMEHLSSPDPRFVWDAQWGGELDLVDYGRGAVTFAAMYQTILGDEFREFDPNQGNYTLEGAASARIRPVEIAVVFHHVSRHLSDRPKRFPVDWNMLGARVRSGLVRGRTELRAKLDVRSTLQKSFVDYRWEMDGDVRTQVRLTPHVAAVGVGGLRLVGVDGSRVRGNQYGWRADGGLRFDGGAAALELFVAGERRVDPYQLEFSNATWLTTGFRLLSR